MQTAEVKEIEYHDDGYKSGQNFEFCLLNAFKYARWKKMENFYSYLVIVNIVVESMSKYLAKRSTKEQVKAILGPILTDAKNQELMFKFYMKEDKHVTDVLNPNCNYLSVVNEVFQVMVTKAFDLTDCKMSKNMLFGYLTFLEEIKDNRNPPNADLTRAILHNIGGMFLEPDIFTNSHEFTAAKLIKALLWCMPAMDNNIDYLIVRYLLALQAAVYHAPDIVSIFFFERHAEVNAQKLMEFMLADPHPNALYMPNTVTMTVRIRFLTLSIFRKLTVRTTPDMLQIYCSTSAFADNLTDIMRYSNESISHVAYSILCNLACSSWSRAYIYDNTGILQFVNNRIHDAGSVVVSEQDRILRYDSLRMEKACLFLSVFFETTIDFVTMLDLLDGLNLFGRMAVVLVKTKNPETMAIIIKMFRSFNLRRHLEDGDPLSLPEYVCDPVISQTITILRHVCQVLDEQEASVRLPTEIKDYLFETCTSFDHRFLDIEAERLRRELLARRTNYVLDREQNHLIIPHNDDDVPPLVPNPIPNHRDPEHNDNDDDDEDDDDEDDDDEDDDEDDDPELREAIRESEILAAIQDHYYNEPADGEKLEITEEEQRIADIKEGYECVVCLVSRRDTALFPCKHMVCCEECSVKIEKCPLCRRTIRKRVKLFV